MRVVYGVSNAMVDGFRIIRGQPWYADDPLVKANPGLFSDDPMPFVATSAPISEDDLIERVTAAPGEKRGAVKRG